MFTYTYYVYKFFFLKMIYLSLVYECLPDCIFVSHVCSNHETNEGIGSPTTAGCGAPYGCWLLNLGLLQEQHVALALGHFSSPL